MIFAHFYYFGKNSKYGVIEEKDLVRDLEEWDTLYLAGRLHKPVKWFKEKRSLKVPLRNNLESAVRVSFAMMSDEIKEVTFQQLFEKITSLSYMGDVRSGIAEHPDKVRNIVEPHIDSFLSLYSPVLSHLESSDLISIDLQNRKCTVHVADVYKLADKFPPNLFQDSRSAPITRKSLEDRVKAIVWKSSFEQSLKGVLSAGIRNSIYYASRKVIKSFK